jgi:hypothetical protein
MKTVHAGMIGKGFTRKGMIDKFMNALISYQEHPEECSSKCRDVISAYLMSEMFNRKKLTLYRGQGSSREIRDTDFFSCSKDVNEVDDFTGKGCCIFELFVYAPVIDVNDVLKDQSVFPHQKEVIVIGGGTFYKDEALTQRGYIESTRNGMAFFTAYYIA